MSCPGVAVNESRYQGPCRAYSSRTWTATWAGPFGSGWRQKKTLRLSARCTPWRQSHPVLAALSRSANLGGSGRVCVQAHCQSPAVWAGGLEQPALVATRGCSWRVIGGVLWVGLWWWGGSEVKLATPVSVVRRRRADTRHRRHHCRAVRGLQLIVTWHCTRMGGGCDGARHQLAAP